MVEVFSVFEFTDDTFSHYVVAVLNKNVITHLNKKALPV